MLPSKKKETLSLANTGKVSITVSIMITLLVLITVIAGGIGYYYYNQYTQLKANPQALSVSQTKQIVGEVSQLMQLPIDETPQVATVVNPSLVQSHTPFAQAQTGDIILIYTKLKRAILYRPSMHKIIDIAPVVIGASNPTVVPTQIPTETVSSTPTPTGKAKLHITSTP